MFTQFIFLQKLEDAKLLEEGFHVKGTDSLQRYSKALEGGTRKGDSHRGSQQGVIPPPPRPNYPHSRHLATCADIFVCRNLGGVS